MLYAAPTQASPVLPRLPVGVARHMGPALAGAGAMWRSTGAASSIDPE